MKLKSLILAFSLSLCFTVFADNQHRHSEANPPENSPAVKNVSWLGFCEIEIINRSYEDVRVYGVFDDGVPLEPFMIYSFEYPHYISLNFYGYCHYGMDLYIETWDGYLLYAGYTPRRRSIRILPYLNHQSKVDFSTK